MLKIKVTEETFIRSLLSMYVNSWNLRTVVTGSPVTLKLGLIPGSLLRPNFEIKNLNIIFVILLLSFVLNFASSFLSKSRGWDESVYLSLAAGFSKHPFSYGFIGFVDMNYECESCAGHRPPLLPLLLSVFFIIFGPALGPDMAIHILPPLFGMLSVFAVFLLGRELFNDRIGVMAAVILAVIPLHVLFSGQVLTDVPAGFFVTLCMYFYWRGFEKNYNCSKILFFLFAALAILVKYTTMFLFPVCCLLLLRQGKNARRHITKELFFGIILFFLILLPWFLYSQAEYGNPLAAFLHGIKSQHYWGDNIPYITFLVDLSLLLSVFSLVFVIGLLMFFGLSPFAMRKQKSKELFDSKYLLLLLPIFLLLASITLFKYKEPRYFLPALPVFAIFCALTLDSFGHKIGKMLVLTILLSLLSLFLFSQYLMNLYNSPSITCFQDSLEFIKTLPANTVIFSDSSPMIYYSTYFECPALADLNTVQKRAALYSDRPVYVFWSVFDSNRGKKELDSFSFLQKSYVCASNGAEYAVLYKYT